MVRGPVRPDFQRVQPAVPRRARCAWSWPRVQPSMSLSGTPRAPPCDLGLWRMASRRSWGGTGPARSTAIRRGATRACETPAEHVHGPVEPEIELFELIMVAALRSRLKIHVQLLEPAYGFRVTVLDGTGRKFPGEQSLADEHVTDVVPGQRDDDEAAAGLKPYQALRTQFQQALTHRSGADTQVLRNRFGPNEIPAVQFPGDDEVAYVRRGLGAQLRAMAAVLPRPVRKLLGRLGHGSSVPGNGLSTALRRLAGHGCHEKGLSGRAWAAAGHPAADKWQGRRMPAAAIPSRD